MISDHLGTYLNFYCQPAFNFSRAVQCPLLTFLLLGKTIEMTYELNQIELNSRRDCGVVVIDAAIGAHDKSRPRFKPDTLLQRCSDLGQVVNLSLSVAYTSACPAASG